MGKQYSTFEGVEEVAGVSRDQMGQAEFYSEDRLRKQWSKCFCQV